MRETKKLTVVSGLAVFSAVLVTALISWVLYQHTVNILTINLKERLLGIVRTAAVEIDYRDLEVLKVEEDWKRPEWNKIVTKLRNVREANENVLFVYIFRKVKGSPEKLEFVSDSHSINPYAQIDLNHDQVIDDADLLQWPGQPYEDPPEEVWLGFEKPVTNNEVYHDQWGSEITGYAPIKDDNQNTVAVIAVDIKADDFSTLTRQTLYPFVLFIFGLIAIIFMLSFVIVHIYIMQIKLFAELDRQKDELIGLVSHQLAAPVSAVKWYVEMLLDGDLGKLNKEQSEQLQTVQKTAGSLSDLVSMILDVSRIQLGRMKIEKQELDMNEFFKEIFVVAEPRAAEKKIQFNKNLPSNLPKAMLDKRYTRMTVENLMTNAIKYTPDGGKVDVNVRIEGNFIFVSVKDTGCGIPVKDQKQIFGKMYRASNVRNSTIDGNGFGLYVAKGAVESQGGQIWFESAEGKGTTFYVKLPLK